MSKFSLRELAIWIGALAARRPKLILVLVAIMTIGLGAGMSQLRIDSTVEGLFGADDPAQIAYRKFQREFGREDVVVAAVSSDKIFTGEFMQQLRAFHQEIEQSVPWLDDVRSIANADFVDSDGGTLRIGNLGDRWPASGTVPAALREELLASPLYSRTLLSPDGQMTLVAIRPVAFVPERAQTGAGTPAASGPAPTGLVDRAIRAVVEWHDELDAKLKGTKKPSRPEAAAESSDFPTISTPEVDSAGEQAAAVGLDGQQMKAFLGAISKVMAKHNGDGFEIRLSGGPVIDDAHHDAIHRDIGLMTGLAFIVIVGALALQLRSVLGVALPILVVVASLISTLGLMGWLGIPITVVSQALPPILLTIGVLGSVHMLSQYFRDPDPDIVAVVRRISAHCGIVITYVALTDAAGFVSFTIARMQPISQFGWMAAFGAIIALIYTLLLLPALLCTFPPKRDHAPRLDFFNRISRVLVPIGDFSTRRPWLVLGGVGALIVVAAIGVSRTTYAHDVLSWFSKDHPVRTSTLAIDKRMQATVPLEIVLDTGKENGILTPEFMTRLRAFEDYCKGLSEGELQVGSATSIVDSLERIHHVLTNGRDGSLPRNERLLHQEILLYEGGGAKEIEQLTDRRYSKARVTMRMAWADAYVYSNLGDKLQAKAREIFGANVQVTVTGTSYLQSLGALDVIDSMWSSYLLAAVLIGVMLIIVLRQVRLAVASLVPNFLPVFVGIGAMGFLGLPVDMFTVLLGGIVLGVSVDDTLHFMHTTIRHRIDQLVDIRTAVSNTLREVGPAMIISGLVIASGFYMFGFSSITPLSRFGILLGTILVAALVFDSIVSPAIVTVVDRGFGGDKEEIKLRKEKECSETA